LRDLSRQSGIPYSTIYDVLESGKTQPDNLTARNLKRLARTLGTSIDYLVGTWEEDDQELAGIIRFLDLGGTMVLLQRIRARQSPCHSSSHPPTESLAHPHHKLLLVSSFATALW